MNWSEVRKPCEECSYDHIVAETPLGKIFIEWKGWKQGEVAACTFDLLNRVYTVVSDKPVTNCATFPDEIELIHESLEAMKRKVRREIAGRLKEALIFFAEPPQ